MFFVRMISECHIVTKIKGLGARDGFSDAHELCVHGSLRRIEDT